MASTMVTPSWHNLPNEMKLAVVDFLGGGDVISLSKVDQRTYQVCVPGLFKNVRLVNYEAVERFILNVPRNYCAYIHDLLLCTKCDSNRRWPSDVAVSVNTLLSATTSLFSLDLQIEGSLDKTVLPSFTALTNLRTLSITNCANEIMMPLSERFAVYIAASTPHLEDLCLDRISRSNMHAPDLEGAYPCPPLALNDNDIPDHPIFGSNLCLPSLLRIPTLRKLTIRDTHLGHEGWSSVPVGCRLQVLDLGSCYHEDEDFNTRCTERIMSTVGPTIDEFSLATAVSSKLFAKPSLTPLQNLRQLHITPFFPVDSVVETVSNLAGSPVERISVRCFEEDVVDVCTALEEFLAVRVERGPEFYDKLQRIEVAITSSDLNTTKVDREEWQMAAKRLQELCRDLRLASAIASFDKMVADLAKQLPESSAGTKRLQIKSRSMSI